MFDRDYWLRKPFYDRKKFPYGFSRAGDFTIAEADFLEKHGSLYKALYDGQVNNPNNDDVRILEMSRGELSPKGFAEQTWSKYLTKRYRTYISLNDTGRASDDADDYDGLDFEVDDSLEA